VLNPPSEKKERKRCRVCCPMSAEKGKFNPDFLPGPPKVKTTGGGGGKEFHPLVKEMWKGRVKGQTSCYDKQDR